VVAAVGFKGRRLEIPSSIDPKVAALIESCWVRYLVTYLLLFIFSELNDQKLCSAATIQQYFSFTPNQHHPPVPARQQYFSLTTNQHQPPATASRTE